MHNDANNDIILHVFEMLSFLSLYLIGRYLRRKVLLCSGALIDVEDLHSLNDEWRKKEAKDLMDLTLSRIRYLQVKN